MTWGEIWREAAGQAAALLAAGVAVGDRVLVVLPTCREYLAAFFGTLLAGAIPVPAAPPASGRGAVLAAHLRLLHAIAADAGVAAWVVEPRLVEILCPRTGQVQVSARGDQGRTQNQGGQDSGRQPRGRSHQGEAGRPAHILAPGGLPVDCLAGARTRRPDREEIALLQYTSGSTSAPKGVALSHRNLIANVAAIASLLADVDAVGFSWLPLHHDMGLIGTLLTALYARVPVTLMPPQAFIKEPARWLRGIAECGATITAAPNFAFDYAVANIAFEEVADIRLDCLQVALNGAEPVDAATVAGFEEKFRPLGMRAGVVRPVYGLAECALAVTFAEPGGLRLDSVDAARLEQDGQAVPAAAAARRRTFISVGRPVPGLRVAIAVPAAAGERPLAERQVGEILVQGDSVMQGYHGRAAASARALRGGWLRTGDLGYLAGGRLFVTGRAKDLIIRHGRNYYPHDIEQVVGQVEGVRCGSVVTFSVEGAAAGAAAVVRVVVVAETRLRDPEALAALERRIRQDMHDAFLFGPDDVLLARHGVIPRTTSGKVRRHDCKRLYLTGGLERSQRSDLALARSTACAGEER